ncbi:hypothetical protein O181_019927 [Austropuccinia psidii MF-1]|uniref:Uncharacterized protein n=1 Tax=Austropuccinia psidii MF-1 TaxID=1389203 RepID=A0A9Q3CCI6_9BASI|nr:hypothetical protein [Austropuccinia psidii MF-1]
MSSKMTELTGSSHYAPPPSVLFGFGILSRLASPWSMASFGNFDPGQIYDGYKVVEVLYHPCTELTGSRKRDVARWTNVGGSIPVGGRSIYSSLEFPISRINTKGVVKRIRRIADSPPDLDAEGSDELDEEVEVVKNPIGQQSSTSPSQLPAKRFQVLLEASNQLFQPFLLPFLLLYQVLPTPGLPSIQK